jgi:hypothetical protein
MKNYLFKSLFKINNTDWQVLDRSHEHTMFDNYQLMHDLSLQSAKKFLLGDWQLVYLTGEFDHINQAFEHTFWQIKQLWDQEPCNILYTDPDTVFVRPLNIWNQFDQFMMFNYTDPRKFAAANSYNKSFEHFFNAGVRYFPHTMNKETWNTGADMAQNWDHSTYDTEQIILNTMLWSQNISLDQALHPEIAYQAFRVDQPYIDQWNGISVNQAHIVHVHSSRNSSNRLNLMKNICQQLQL